MRSIKRMFYPSDKTGQRRLTEEAKRKISYYFASRNELDINRNEVSEQVPTTQTFKQGGEKASQVRMTRASLKLSCGYGDSPFKSNPHCLFGWLLRRPRRAVTNCCSCRKISRQGTKPRWTNQDHWTQLKLHVDIMIFLIF